MGKIGRPQNEVNAMKYKNFLKRGFRFNRRVSRASKSELINLINCENGIKHTFLPNREKQLSEIKGRLIKAIELIIKNNHLDKINEKALSDLSIEVNNANSSSDINKIVESGLYFSQENK